MPNKAPGGPPTEPALVMLSFFVDRSVGATSYEDIC